MGHDTICTGAKLSALADAIRERAGTGGRMTIDAMAEAVAGIAGDGAMAALAGRTLTSIPEAEAGAITAVGDYAFAYCEGLAGEVVLPNAEEIGFNAFDRCPSVTAIVAPRCRKMNNLGLCAGLERLELPSLELCMGFLLAPRLRALRLPECTTCRMSVSGGAGAGSCASLERIWLPKATTLPTDGSNTPLAKDVTTLTSVSLDAATNVHGYSFGSAYYLLSGCTSLASVNLPSATTLGAYVFCGCSSLTTLYLPSCTSLDRAAIGRGTPVEALVLPGEEMCRLSGALDGSLPIARGTGHVYVPGALLDDYGAASNWSAYAAQLRAIEDWPEVAEAARLGALAATLGWD